MRTSTKWIIVGISALAFGLTAAGVWIVRQGPGTLPAAIPDVPSPAPAPAVLTLEAYLSQPGSPANLREELPRFRKALEAIAEAAKAQGLTFPWRPEGVEATESLNTLPWELRETVAHPYVRWGRDPRTGRWDAIVVLAGPKLERRVLAWVRDALGSPKLTLSPFEASEAGLIVSDAWEGESLPDVLAARPSRPIQDFCWFVPETDYAMGYSLHPVRGLGRCVDGIEGEDEDESGESTTITRADLGRAQFLEADSARAWFRLDGQLRSAKRAAWEAWKNPARPDVKKPEESPAPTGENSGGGSVTPKQ